MLCDGCDYVVTGQDVGFELKDGLFLGNSVTTTEDNKLHGVIVNTIATPQQINKMDLLGAATVFVRSIDAINNWDTNAIITSKHTTNTLPSLTNTDLSEEQQNIVCDLLCNYKDIFAEELIEPGVLKGVECTIPTLKASKLLYKHDYRKTSEQHEEITKQVESKLDKRICERGTGRWGSPVLLVLKKTGGYRMCVDLRGLNAVTDVEIFLMPRIDDMFDAVQGDMYFSLCDVTSGYWQVNLWEEDREKAAFVTRDGLFQPTTMDFGMMNAPAIWQCAMTLIFSGLL